MASQKKIDSGETGRSNGKKYERLLAKEIGGRVMPDKKVDSINGKKTTHKADIINLKENNLLISVKNPRGYSISTQIHVCPLQSLKIYLSTIPYIVETALKAFVGDFPKNHRGSEDKENFYSLCKSIGIKDPDQELSPLEKKRFRVDCFSLGEENSNAIINWAYENREALYRFIFQDGIMCSTVSRPDELWWAQKQNDLKNISRFNICDIISCANKLEKHEVKFNNEKGKNNTEKPKQQTGTVIRIGAVTLQMKGSGEDSSSYHYPQFNCSLKDLEKMMEQKGLKVEEILKEPLNGKTEEGVYRHTPLALFKWGAVEDIPSYKPHQDFPSSKLMIQVSNPPNPPNPPSPPSPPSPDTQQSLDLNICEADGETPNKH